MDTPHTYFVLTCSVLCTVVYTVLYSKLYPEVYVAGWEDLFPGEHPCPFSCKLYLTLFWNCTLLHTVTLTFYCTLYNTLFCTHNQSGWLSWFITKYCKICTIQGTLLCRLYSTTYSRMWCLLYCTLYCMFHSTKMSKGRHILLGTVTSLPHLEYTTHFLHFYIHCNVHCKV